MRVSIVSTILLSQLIVISSASSFRPPAKSWGVLFVNSVLALVWAAGWPRRRKKLVAEGGRTLPLSPCQLGQLCYCSSPCWQIKYRATPPHHHQHYTKSFPGRSLSGTPRTLQDNSVSSFSRLFQSVCRDQAWHISPVTNQVAHAD